MSSSGTIAGRPSALSERIRDLQTAEANRKSMESTVGLIRSHRTVLVGPARTLIGMNAGPAIDSFDAVVRINDIFLVEEDPAFRKDFGSRTDVLYCNQKILKDALAGAERKKFLSYCRGNHVKAVVCTNNSLDYDESGSPAAKCPAGYRSVLKDMRAVFEQELPLCRFGVVTTASQVVIEWLNGDWGRTGFVATVDLLLHNPAQLHLTGMTLYHGGGHVLERAADLDPRGNRDGTSSVDPGTGKGHDSTAEARLLKGLMNELQPQITVDSGLHRVLEQSNGEWS